MYQKRELLKFPIFFQPQDFQTAEYKCQKFHTAEITGYMIVKIKDISYDFDKKNYVLEIGK